MKIWVDKKTPAPKEYSWKQNADEAIAAIKKHDLAVELGMRRGHECFLNRDYAGRDNCYKFANRHDVEEISISEEMVGGDDAKKIHDYLVEIGRSDYCKIAVH